MLRNSIRSFSSSISRQSFARIQLLGTVGRIESKETRDGNKFLTYSLAVNKFNPQAEDQKQTDWYNVAVFNDSQVSSMEKIVKKGAQLLVEADVQQRVLIDEDHNQTRVANYKQLKYDVVRFARKEEPEAEEAE